MASPLPTALVALRPVRTALVGGPAVVGWIWAGATPGTAAQGVAVFVGAWLLALGAFAWNDRADAERGIAHLHPGAAVRALAGSPAASSWLLLLGTGCVLAGIALWGWLGAVPACLGVAVAASGWIYSDPVYFGKARPLPATVLHLVGGGCNAAVGVLAARGEVVPAVTWGLSMGLLFAAAHRIHAVGDREIDRRSGVRILAADLSFDRTARRAAAGLALVCGALVVAGLTLGGGRGAGLAGLGLGVAGYLGLNRPLPPLDPRSWAVFQRGCRIAVAVSALAGAVLARAMEAP